MIRSVNIVSNAGNEVTFRSYGDNDPDMSILVEHFTRVLDEDAVIQLYNFMKEHYERTIESKFPKCIKHRFKPDFGREKVCYVPYLGLPDDMVDSSYIGFRDLMGRVEPMVSINQSKYDGLQRKADEFEVMKKDRDDYKFECETWKKYYEDLSEMYDDLQDKYDAIYDKLESVKEDLSKSNQEIDDWKRISNIWRSGAENKEDELYLEQHKVKLLLNYLEREGYEAEFMYNSTVLKVKRN